MKKYLLSLMILLSVVFTGCSKVAVPENLRVERTTGNAIYIRWDNTNAKQYKIYRSELESTNYKLLETVTSTDFEDETVKNDKVYYYKVTSVKKKKESGFSRILKVEVKKDQRYVKLWGNFLSHKGFVNKVLIAEKKELAFTAGSDKTVRVWDLNKGNILEVLEGHVAGVTGLAISDDESILASSSEDGTIKLWDIKDLILLNTLVGHKKRVSSVEIVGNKVISGSVDGTIKIWDIKTGKLIKELSENKSPVTRLELSKNKKVLISASINNEIKIWNALTFELIKTLKFESSARSIAIDDKGEKLAYSLFGEKEKENTDIKIYDIKSEKTISKLSGHTDSVNAIKFIQNGDKILSGSADKTVRIWDIKFEQELSSLEGTYYNINDVAMTYLGDRAVIASKNGVLVYTLK